MSGVVLKGLGNRHLHKTPEFTSRKVSGPISGYGTSCLSSSSTRKACGAPLPDSHWSVHRISWTFFARQATKDIYIITTWSSCLSPTTGANLVTVTQLYTEYATSARLRISIRILKRQSYSHRHPKETFLGHSHPLSRPLSRLSCSPCAPLLLDPSF